MDNLDEKIPKKAILGIYTKQPRPGEVKTRLCPPLSHEEAADLYACALRETVTRMRQLDCRLVLCYAGDRQWFAEAFPGVELLPQSGSDLGARMADSFDSLLKPGGCRVVLIGSDTPDLPLARIEQAFDALLDNDVVLAPAADGGYVLIGEAQHHPQLFTQIAWSSNAVLTTTLQRIADQGISCAQLSGWEDLDDFPALQRLLERSPQSDSANFLRQKLAYHF